MVMQIDKQEGLNILEAIIYQSRTEKKYFFPRDGIRLYSGILKALTDYIVGATNAFPDPEYNSEPLLYWRFQDELKKANSMETNPLMHKRRDFASGLSGSGVLEPKGSGTDMSGEFSYSSGFSRIYKEICNQFPGDTFTLTEETLKHIEKDVLPKLSDDIFKEIDVIAHFLRKHIEEDIVLYRRRNR